MSISDNSIEYQFIDKFCDYVSFKNNLKQNTIIAYKSDLKIFLSWISNNNNKFSDVDRVVINNYLASRLDSGVSVSTIQRIITCIKSFYLFLYENNFIQSNTAQLIDNPKKRRKLPIIISENEIEALLSCPNTDTSSGMRDKCIL